MSGDLQDKDRAGLIDRLMSPYHGDAPGASVLVIRGGAVLCRRAYGLADLEGHVAATPATNYRLASMTKQFTAAAVLLLEEDGCLSLDDPIRKWLPTLPVAVDPCTIRHLLTHVSGLIDYEELIPAGQSRQLRDDDVLRLLESQDRTYFTPGARFRYSDTGYSLLALIVGRAARADFASFLRRRIFLPLDMHGTVAYTPGVSVIPARAFGYTYLGARWARTDQSLTSAVLGDGGIYSSIDDLARWDDLPEVRVVEDEQVVPLREDGDRRIRERLQRPGSPVDADPGLGLEALRGREQGVAAALVVPGDALELDRAAHAQAGAAGAH